jgi:shikimate kinase
MSYSSRIFLTGFMASGKSTIGSCLADRLRYEHVDLDRLLETRTGRSIPDIFEQSGEKEFRRLEASTLQSVIALEKTVISLGGGALERAGSLDQVLQNGTVVYLSVEMDVLIDRIMMSDVRRPLLETAGGRRLDGDGLASRLKPLYESRLPLYRRAHITVLTGAMGINETVETVLTALEAHGEHNPEPSDPAPTPDPGLSGRSGADG